MKSRSGRLLESEAALWDKFQIITQKQRRKILNSGIHTAMTPYGIRLFLTGKSVTILLEISMASRRGIMVASPAAEHRTKNFAHTMLAQQMRNSSSP